MVTLLRYKTVVSILLFLTALFITAFAYKPLHYSSFEQFSPVENISIQFSAKPSFKSSNMSPEVASSLFLQQIDSAQGVLGIDNHSNLPFGHNIQLEFDINGDHFAFDLLPDNTVFRDNSVISAVDPSTGVVERFKPRLTTYRGTSTNSQGEVTTAIFTIMPQASIEDAVLHEIVGDSGDLPSFRSMAIAAVQPEVSFHGTVFLPTGESLSLAPVGDHLASSYRHIQTLKEQLSIMSKGEEFSAMAAGISETQNAAKAMYMRSLQSKSLSADSTYHLLSVSSIDNPSAPCGDGVEVPDADGAHSEAFSSTEDKEADSPLARTLHSTLPFLAKWTGCSDLTKWDARGNFKLSLTVDFGFAKLASSSTSTVNIARTTASIAQSVAAVNYVYEGLVSTFFTVSRLDIRTGLSTTEPWNSDSLAPCSSSTMFDTFGTYVKSAAYGPRDAALIHLITSCSVAEGYSGLAHVGGLCSSTSGFGWSNLIVGDWRTLAHELGHNHGLSHTFPRYPQGTGLGIMDYSNSVISASVAANDPNFGRMSFAELTDKAVLCETIQTTLSNTADYCLTIERRSSSGSSLCGNGVIDHFFGEECDNGAPDSCCDENCRLRSGAICTQPNTDCCTADCKPRIGWCQDDTGFCTTTGCKVVVPSNDYEMCDTPSFYECYLQVKPTGKGCGTRYSNHIFGFGHPCTLPDKTTGTCVPTGDTDHFKNIACVATEYSWTEGIHRPCDCANGLHYEINEYHCTNNGGQLVSSSYCAGLPPPTKPKLRWCDCLNPPATHFEFQPKPVHGACPSLECGTRAIPATNASSLKCYRTIEDDDYYREEVTLSQCGSSSKTCTATQTCGTPQTNDRGYTCSSTNTCVCRNGFGGTRCTSEPSLSNLRAHREGDENNAVLLVGDPAVVRWNYSGGSSDNKVTITLTAGSTTIEVATNVAASAQSATFTVSGDIPSTVTSATLKLTLNQYYTLTATAQIVRTCNHSPGFCGSNGTCNVETSSCDCHSGFEGSRCEVDICQSVNCVPNQGTCDPATRTCECKQGFEGDKCESDICKSLACVENQGTCNLANRTCDCVDGYEGTHCETSICEALNCHPEHGACNTTTRQCDCQSGWIGSTCSVDVCSVLDCDPDNSTCNPSTSKCDCVAPFFGPTCEQKPCDAISCGHGECDDEREACTCETGWIGDHCDTPETTCDDVTPPNCSGNGDLVPVSPESDCEYFCECDDHWETPSSPPLGTYCTQCGLECSQEGSSGPSTDCSLCVCHPGYSGPSCDCHEIYFSLTFTRASSPLVFLPLFSSLRLESDGVQLSTGYGFIQSSNQDLTPKQRQFISLLLDLFSILTGENEDAFRWVLNHVTFGSTASTSSSGGPEKVTLFFSYILPSCSRPQHDLIRFLADSDEASAAYEVVNKIIKSFEDRLDSIVAHLGLEQSGEESWPVVSPPHDPRCKGETCPGGATPYMDPVIDDNTGGDDDDGSSFKLLYIILIAVGGGLVLIALVALVLWLCLRRRDDQVKQPASTKQNDIQLSSYNSSAPTAPSAPVAPTAPMAPSPPVAPAAATISYGGSASPPAPPRAPVPPSFSTPTAPVAPSAPMAPTPPRPPQPPYH